MFFVIKDSFIFSCMVERDHVPNEHLDFVFSEEEILDFPNEMLIDIFNRNDLENRKLESLHDSEEVTQHVSELLNLFKLPERRTLMAKKEAPAAEAATEDKGPSKRDAVITLKVEENPKRAGSKAHERFALYQSGQTVAQFIEAGGTMADVNYDVAKGFIELAE